MTSLSETLFNFYEVMKSIEENDGVIDNNLLPTLIKNESLVYEKVDKYCDFIDAVHAQIEQQKKFFTDIKDRIKKLENLESHLKNNAKDIMISYNISEIKGNNRKMKVNNAGGVLSINFPEDFYQNEKTVNKNYVRFLTSDMYEKKEVYVLNIDKVREYLEFDGELECARLLDRSKYLKVF